MTDIQREKQRGTYRKIKTDFVCINGNIEKNDRHTEIQRERQTDRKIKTDFVCINRNRQRERQKKF
jgi:hypothetical protein